MRCFVGSVSSFVSSCRKVVYASDDQYGMKERTARKQEPSSRCEKREKKEKKERTKDNTHLPNHNGSSSATEPRNPTDDTRKQENASCNV